MPAQIFPFPGQQPSLASPMARDLRIGDDHKPSAGLHAGGRLDEQKGGEWTRSRPIARQPSPGPLFRRGRP